jgi:predicted nucleotidyltransferase
MRFGLPEGTIKSILSVLKNHPKVVRAVLYGSRAKGNFRNGSDIDLALEAPTMDLSELLRLENELDDLLLPYKIDLTLLHMIENADLLDHIKRIGVDFKL